MKAKINNQNKAKFFALYYDECVLMRASYVKSTDIVNIKGGLEIDVYGEELYLSLKPLSSISDEDAIEVAKIVCKRHNRHYNQNEISYEMSGRWDVIVLVNKSKRYKVQIMSDGIAFIDNYHNGASSIHYYCPNQFEACDYLTSKGYAFNRMGLSVQEMVNAGWIKLQEI